MSIDPTAQAAYRVPRSEVDAFYVPGEQMPVSRAGAGTVVSVDSSNTCTVLINDEEVTGVMWLGTVPPRIGDVVEVEMRGDLLVVPAINDLDTFLEGQESDVAHIVSDTDPGSPPAQDLQVGGSMRSTDAWFFAGTDTANWSRELSESGQGMSLYQPTPPGPSAAAILWSETTFDVVPGDVVHFEMDLAEIAQDTTAQAYVLYSGVEGSAPLPGGPDTLQVAVGSAQPLTAAVSTLLANLTIPETVTLPISGAVEPGTARLGVRVVGSGASQVLAAGARATLTSRSWPLGSQWMDPDAETGGLITIGDSGITGSGTLSSTTVDTAIPFAKKAIITAPEGTGGVVVVTFHCAVGLKSALNSLYLRLTVGAAGGSIITQTWLNGPTDGGNVPITIVGSVQVAAGEEVTVLPTYAYAGTSVTVPHTINRMQTMVEFFPGAVRSGGSSDPHIRYWDGDSWRPQKLRSATFDLTKDASVVPPSKTNTTTSCNRSASTLHEGATLTISSTVAPTTSGTVTFYRSSSASGPWTSMGTATLSAGKASKTWKTTAGSWYFKNTFAGSATHNPSTSAVTPATVVQRLVTKTITLACSWAQAYEGSGAKLSGTGHDSAVRQGYYGSGDGNCKSLLRFNHSAIPAAAAVTAVTLICKSGGWDHWYSYSGGDLIVGSFNNTPSEPATWPTSDIAPDRSRHAVEEGGWSVNLSSWALGSLGGSIFSGLTIGPGPSNSQAYYGYSASPGASQFTLKVTYENWE